MVKRQQRLARRQDWKPRRSAINIDGAVRDSMATAVADADQLSHIARSGCIRQVLGTARHAANQMGRNYSVISGIAPEFVASAALG